MIFQNTDTQTVILSARKCGLITLGATVTKEYKTRLIQMGENPKTVFNYGSLN